MPYLPQERRTEIHKEIADKGIFWRPGNAGDLNYVMTRVIDNFIDAQGGPRYAHLNTAIAVLDLAKPSTYPPIQKMAVQDGLGRRDPRARLDHNVLSAAIKAKSLDWAPQDPGEMLAVFVAYLESGALDIIDATGAVECCKLELYRIIGGPYEDVKLAENGPAYTVDPAGGFAY